VEIFFEERKLTAEKYGSSTSLNTTPDVSFDYDDYNLLVTMTDGIGTYSYTYYDNNKLQTIDGPWDDDMITYVYNELGHQTSLSVQLDATNSRTITYKYDYDTEYPADADLGRLKSIQTDSGNFEYAYTGVNSLVQSLTRPNGSVTDYSYDTQLKWLDAITNNDSASALINSFSFTHNDKDLIDTETASYGYTVNPPNLQAVVNIYQNNLVNQIESETSPARTYLYDDDGNMTQGYTPEGYVMTMTYDAENRLISTEYTDSDSVIHRTEYYYSGNNLLAEVKKFENGALTTDSRYLRAEFLGI
jgi:YD repeat-containing protein